MSDEFYFLSCFTCPDCGHVGLRHCTHHEDGRVQYWLACTHCVWEQAGLFNSLREAISDFLFGRTGAPPAIAPPLPTAEAYRRMAAAAEQQAADLHIIREVLETLLDTLAAQYVGKR